MPACRVADARVRAPSVAHPTPNGPRLRGGNFGTGNRRNIRRKTGAYGFASDSVHPSTTLQQGGATVLSESTVRKR